MEICHLALECVPSAVSVVVFGCVRLRALDHVHFVRCAVAAGLGVHPFNIIRQRACVLRERISHKV